MTTRDQHYVWKYYLKGWCHNSRQICCLRNTNRKPIWTDPKNIMVERDFYRLTPFSKEDMDFFDYWLNKVCPPEMKANNRSTFSKFVMVANGNKSIWGMNNATASEKEHVLRLAIELEEILHGDIEKRAVPLLNQLRQERLDFLCDDESTISFFQFLAHQHFRTKRVRENTRQVLASLRPGLNFSQLRHVFCYCFADNFGGSLFVDRNRLQIVFLRNQNSGFITGDQPLVNLAANDNMKHDDVVMYYPLSPQLAVLVGFTKFQHRSVEISTEIVKQLNETMAFFSSQFLVADSETLLMEWVKKPQRQLDVLSLIT